MRKELFFAHSLLRTGTQQGLAKWQLQLGMGLSTGWVPESLGHKQVEAGSQGPTGILN